VTSVDLRELGYWSLSRVSALRVIEPLKSGGSAGFAADNVLCAARRQGASLPNWMGEGAWSLSASDTTARATARAAYRPGAVTVTTLMIVSAMCTLMMLANRRDAAWSAATANVTGSGSWPPSRATLMISRATLMMTS